MAGGRSVANELRLLCTSKRAITDDYIRYMDRAAGRCRYPYGLAAKMAPIPIPTDPVSPALLMDMSPVQLRDADNETQNDLLMVSLALRAYKLERGSYPAVLSQLTPVYLSRVPADPFSAGVPLKYRASSGSYALYSVGPDGVDDGGKPIVDSSITGRYRYAVLQNSKGDIVAGVNTL